MVPDHINHPILDFKNMLFPTKVVYQYEKRGYQNLTYSAQIWLYNGKVILDYINHQILDFKNMPSPTRNPASVREQRLSKLYISRASLVI